jgi:hypothetical protein
MAAFNKFQSFTKNVAEGKINLASDQLKIALTNVAPVATNAVLADLTEISYTNASTRNITTSSSTQSGGVYKLTVADLVVTASGGSVGPFRYVAVYDDTPTSPAKPLIGWYDYGSSITLNAGETFTTDFDQVNGLLTIT